MIDDILRKDDPDACIPWSGGNRPAWAFHPASVLDIGAATGRFTASALQRLSDWGCLGALQHLHLVEQERGIDGLGGPGAAAAVRDRCRQALANSHGQDAKIALSNGSIEVLADGAGNTPQLVIEGVRVSAADLVIASHVTYYFPGGGRVLLEAIASMLRLSGGLGWIVVRRRDCPIYRARTRHRASSGEAAVEAYAEDIEQWIRSAHSALDLVDARDQSYLSDSIAPASRRAAASLLMWRTPVDALTDEERKLLDAVVGTAESLFAERHFIVRSAR